MQFDILLYYSHIYVYLWCAVNWATDQLGDSQPGDKPTGRQPTGRHISVNWATMPPTITL